jgi:A/G-specific adenine glycosylase
MIQIKIELNFAQRQNLIFRVGILFLGLLTIPGFQQFILNWYSNKARRLPWRMTLDPYSILVSEIMLQQTQVTRVIPKYCEFLSKFPSLDSLSFAPRSTIFQIWQGLGYWKRALNLQATCLQIYNDYNGQFPTKQSILEGMPGIGPYTSAAVTCFAFNRPVVFIDTNIRKVYRHFFFAGNPDVSDEILFPIARKALWHEDPRSWHYALFDYGSIVLRKKSGKISGNFSKTVPYKGSVRQLRSKIIHLILNSPNQLISRIVLHQILDKMKSHYIDGAPQKAITSLIKDAIIKDIEGNYLI